jgi:RimJ/RimL family protein N-acetyltransferase
MAVRPDRGVVERPGTRASRERDDAEHVTLRDGREVVISPLTSADAPLLVDAFERLSQESRWLRFLGPKASLTTAELRYLTEIDGHNHEALTAIDPGTGRGVAIGRWVRDPDHPERAEVAITVADDWQRRGLGKLVLGQLADRAREEGVRTFTALVSVDNRGMQALLARLDGPATVEPTGGGAAEWQIELAPKGLGQALEQALRAAAAGQLQLPPRLCEVLRALVPVGLQDG